MDAGFAMASAIGLTGTAVAHDTSRTQATPDMTTAINATNRRESALGKR